MSILDYQVSLFYWWFVDWELHLAEKHHLEYIFPILTGCFLDDRLLVL